MKMLYRGVAYELNYQSVQTAPQSHVRLTYRGQTYHRQPQLAGNKLRATIAAVTLTYRGHSYERQMPAFNGTQSLPTPAFTLAVAS